MSSLNSLLALGKQALLAQQIGMHVTENNVSNAQNPNYSRQRVQFVTDQYIRSGNFYLGSGVQIESVNRIRDQIYDIRFWNENASMSRWDTELKYDHLVEGVFNDLTGSGLSEQIDAFWNAWMELGNHPQDEAQRRNVYSKTEGLINTFHNIDAQLHTITTQAKKELENNIVEVNRLTSQIAKLNQQISDQASGDGSNNTVLDQRDALINELTSFIDISVTYHEDNTVTLYTNYLELVNKVESFQLKSQTQTINGQENIEIFLYGTQSSELSAGKLKGLVDTINNIIPEYLHQLDDIAQTIVENVNKIHRVNYNLEGSSGFDFFDSTGIKAGSIQLSNHIKNSIQNIAVSKNGQAGDGRGAIDISNIRDLLLLQDKTATINDSYNTIVSQIGERSRFAEQSFDNQSGIVNMIENQRQAIMGVSIDEEMINMIKFQTAFGAASKIITSVDDMMKTVLNMV